jgi:hypothetical protein
MLPSGPLRNKVLQYGDRGDQDNRYLIAKMLDAVEKLLVNFSAGLLIGLCSTVPKRSSNEVAGRREPLEGPVRDLK